MHAPAAPDARPAPSPATAEAASLHSEKLSQAEKHENKRRNEAQLDKEPEWDNLKQQVKGTLAFLDSESSWQAFKLFNSASRPVKALLSSTGPDSDISSLTQAQGYDRQAVLYPKSSKDVLAAINFAYKSGIEISVKSGGYNPSSWSTRGTLILDLKQLQSVIVHPTAHSSSSSLRPNDDGSGMQIEPTVHERSRDQLTSSGLAQQNNSNHTDAITPSSSSLSNGQKRKYSPSPDSGADSAMPPASETTTQSSRQTSASTSTASTSISSGSSGSATPPIQTLLSQQAQDNANNAAISSLAADKGKRRMLDSDRAPSPSRTHEDQTHFIHANAYPPFNLVNADPEQSRAFHQRRQSQDMQMNAQSGQSVAFIYDPIRKETVFPGNAPPGTVPFSDAPQASSNGTGRVSDMHSASTSTAASNPNTAWPTLAAGSSIAGSGAQHGSANANGTSSSSPAENAFGAADPSNYNFVSFGSGTTARHLDSVSATSDYVRRHTGDKASEEPNKIARNDSGLECFVPWACYPVGSAIFLTGGYGFVSRLYGLSMDLVTQLEIVLPPTSPASSVRAQELSKPPPMVDGELGEKGRIVTLKVDYQNDPDLTHEEKLEQEELWWACRGAGTAFGIVTNITCKAYNIGQVLAGNVIFPFNPATTPSLLKHWRDCLKVAPRELYTNFTLTAGPSERGHAVVIQFSWCGKNISEGEAILQTMLSWDGERCLLKDVEVRPYKHQQENVSQILSSKENTRWLVRSTLLQSLSDNSVHKTIEAFRTCQPGASWLFETAGGAIAEPQYPSCFPMDHRKAPFQVAALHQWTDPRHDEIQKKSAESWVYDVLKDEQCGPFPCFLSSGEKKDRIEAVYGEKNFARLKELKRKYDPHCLLKHTHFEGILNTE